MGAYIYIWRYLILCFDKRPHHPGIRELWPDEVPAWTRQAGGDALPDAVRLALVDFMVQKMRHKAPQRRPVVAAREALQREILAAEPPPPPLPAPDLLAMQLAELMDAEAGVAEEVVAPPPLPQVVPAPPLPQVVPAEAMVEIPRGRGRGLRDLRENYPDLAREVADLAPAHQWQRYVAQIVRRTTPQE